MRVQHTSIGTRQARIFASDDAGAAALLPPAPSEDLDTDDLEREVLLRAALSRELAVIVGYPGEDPRDAWDLHLLDGQGGSLFCCVVVTEACLAKELVDGMRIVEGFCLQVVSAPSITTHVLAGAFETWMMRNFWGIPLPEVLPQVWREAEDLDDVLALDDDEDDETGSDLAEALVEFLGRSAVEEADQAA